MPTASPPTTSMMNMKHRYVTMVNDSREQMVRNSGRYFHAWVEMMIHALAIGSNRAYDIIHL